MTTVSCVGIAVEDTVYGVTKLPLGGGKTHARSKQVIGGGVAANAAATVAALGGSSRYIGAVGNDVTGERLLSELVELGVDVSGVAEVPTTTPTSAVIVDEQGERMIVNHTEPNLFDLASIDIEQTLVGSDSVLVDVRWPEAAEASLIWASSTGVPGVLDLDVGNREVSASVQAATHVIFSTDALLAHTKTNDIRAGLERARTETTAWLAVTAGGQGTYWLDGDEMRHQPSYPVNVVDTTGAGDVFHGAFALRVAETHGDVIDSLAFATAAAAFKCMTFGGRSGIPTRAELEEFMEGWS